jgi:hypothetical protein
MTDAQLFGFTALLALLLLVAQAVSFLSFLVF